MRPQVIFELIGYVFASKLMCLFLFRLVRLRYGEDAYGYLRSISEAIEEDGLTDYFKRNLVALVTGMFSFPCF